MRKGHCCSFTANDVWWTRDNFFSAAANRNTITEILQKHLEKKVLAEKAEAVAIWQQIENLSQEMAYPDPELEEAVQVSCTYGRIKYQLIYTMWVLMIQQGKLEQGNYADKQLTEQTIADYDRLWDEWKQLKASSKYCATLYTDKAFYNQTEGSIGELVNNLRHYNY